MSKSFNVPRILQKVIKIFAIFISQQFHHQCFRVNPDLYGGERATGKLRSVGPPDIPTSEDSEASPLHAKLEAATVCNAEDNG